MWGYILHFRNVYSTICKFMVIVLFFSAMNTKKNLCLLETKESCILYDVWT